MLKIDTIIEAIEKTKTSTQWNKGVKEYAIGILKFYQRAINSNALPPLEILERTLLIGAKDWQAYSNSGRALVSTYEIAYRLFTPGEIKNLTESWNDLAAQTKALKEAYQLIKTTYKDAKNQILNS